MSDEEKKEPKITKLKSISGGKKSGADKPKSATERNQIYVNDARFKQAMDLVRKDMNKAFDLGNLANTQHYLLVKFLIDKGIINEKDFVNFVQNSLSEIDDKEKK